MAKIRAFLAIDFAVNYREKLTELLTQLKGKSANIKWIKPDNAHITLHFFGNIDEDDLNRLKNELTGLINECESFTLSLGKAGVFPNERRPRTIWLSVNGELEKLKKIKKTIDTKLDRMGFAVEKRAFSPHLTLGRVKNMVNCKSIIQNLLSFKSERKMGVKEIILYKSTLTSEGPIYTPIKRFKLRNGNDQA